MAAMPLAFSHEGWAAPEGFAALTLQIKGGKISYFFPSLAAAEGEGQGDAASPGLLQSPSFSHAVWGEDGTRGAAVLQGLLGWASGHVVKTSWLLY